METLLLSLGEVMQSFIDMLTSQSFWVKTVALLSSLSILVFIHELGHYSWARIFGIKVEKFYLFFNPWLTLAKYRPKSKKRKFLFFQWAKVERGEKEDEKKNDDAKDSESASSETKPEAELDEQDQPLPDGVKPTWRDTEYGLGWLPLGGYCAIAGMIDETQSADKLKGEAKSWEFRSKSTWKRLLVMIGGVVNNFLLALVIYAGIVYAYGEQFLPFQSVAQSGLYYSETAHKAGFQDGDIPVSADGTPVRYVANDELKIIMAHEVEVMRGGKKVTLTLPGNFALQVNKDIEDHKAVFIDWMPAVVKQVMGGGGAEKANLQPGDRIIAVDSLSTPTFSRMTVALKANAGKTVQLTLLRQADTVRVAAPLDGNGKLGFQAEADASKLFKTETHTYNIFQSIPRGITLGVNTMTSYVKSLKLLFTKEGAESLGSFGAIGSMFPAQWDWLNFWNVTAFLSIILAVMNIIPIPGLDGGHVMFLLYEMIFRRKPSDKFLEKAQIVGMTLLMILMVYAFGNDIYRFLIK